MLIARNNHGGRRTLTGQPNLNRRRDWSTAENVLRSRTRNCIHDRLKRRARVRGTGRVISAAGRIDDIDITGPWLIARCGARASELTLVTTSRRIGINHLSEGHGVEHVQLINERLYDAIDTLLL